MEDKIVIVPQETWEFLMATIRNAPATYTARALVLIDADIDNGKIKYANASPVHPPMKDLQEEINKKSENA